MYHFRKTVSVLLALVLTLGLFPAASLTGLDGLAQKVRAADIVDSGTCGENLTWTLDSDGLLTISGTGEISQASYPNSVVSVVIGNGVTGIGNSAFSFCSGLTSVTIGNGVTSIGAIAFYCCSGLTSLTIPDSVTSIGVRAFFDCSGLTGVTIPDGVTSIGDSAFSGTAYYNDENNWTDGVLYIGKYLIRAKDDIKGGYTVKDGTRLIAGGAFSGCSGLTSVSIPDSVTSIGDRAFDGCSGLTGVSIPDSVTSIGDRAFRDCSGLTGISVSSGNPKYISNGNCLIEKDAKTLVLGCKNSVIPTDGSVTSIGRGAFSGCSGLTSVTIPDSVTSIGNYAFDGCSGLTSVTIPDGVTSIGYGTFEGCSGLTSVTIPDSVTNIGDEAFYGCSGLTSVTIPDGVTSIGERAFEGCSGLTSVTIPDSVTGIGHFVFSGCSGLTSVTIPDSVTSIGNYAFDGCSGLTSVLIPDSVTSIGYKAFEGCSGLTSVTIGNGVTSIGDSAFSGCSGLTNVTIPDSVTGIGNYAFYGCSGLTRLTIPDSVTSIGNSAFKGCSGLTSVTIPDGVTSIGNSAFYGCSGLTSVTIPDGVTSIGEGAFFYCSGLTSVTIPDSVTSIGYSAFYGCSGLTSVTIPDGVTSIGYGAFDGCTGLTSITVSSGNTRYISSGNCLIEKDTKTLILGCKNSVIPADGSVTSIGYKAFDGCSGLKSVTIPDSVTSIDNWAFYGCSGLTDVYYTGAEAQWNAIDIYKYNDPLISATKHYNASYSEPTTEPSADPPANHSWNDGEITTAATCTSEGVKTYTCTVCGATKTEPIAKDASNHAGGTEVRDAKAATCGEDGYTGDTYCKGCGVKLASGTTVPATGNHTWNDGVVTTAATCASEGVKTFTCAVCKATKTEPTAKDAANHTGGTELKNVKAATCGVDGYTGDTYCKGCGVKIASGTTIPATGHVDKDDDGVCDVCSTVLTVPEPPTQHSTEPGDETTTRPADESTTQSSGETTTQSAGGTTTDPSSEPVSETTTVPGSQSTTTQLDITDNTEKPTMPDSLFNLSGEGISSADTADAFKYASSAALTKSQLVAAITGADNAVLTVKDKDGKELADDAALGTGSTVTVTLGDTSITKTIVFAGDVDGDATVNATDARLALRAAAKLDTLTGAFAAAADTDGDDNINATDARMILRAAAKLEGLKAA